MPLQSLLKLTINRVIELNHIPRRDRQQPIFPRLPWQLHQREDLLIVHGDRVNNIPGFDVPNSHRSVLTGCD